MNAVVLCPGPSLASYQPTGAALTIGVNRAAVAVPCDVWCAGDFPLILSQAEHVIGAPLLFSRRTSLGTIGRRMNPPWRGETLAWLDIRDYLDTSPFDWTWSSMLAAIVYAAWRGASMIEVYGCDWEGTADFDGTEAGTNRDDNRWRAERERYEQLVEILKSRGVQVLRHQPCPTSMTS